MAASCQATCTLLSFVRRLLTDAIKDTAADGSCQCVGGGWGVLEGGGGNQCCFSYLPDLSLSLSLEEGKKAIGGRDRKQHRERLQTSSSGLV